MLRPTWIEELREQPLADAALAAGMQEFPGHSWSPCLSCGAETRGGHDRRRGPIGVRPDGSGWCCHVCKVTGDVVTLAALAATGDPRPSDWTPVREWAEAQGLCASRGSTTRIVAPRPRPARRDPRPVTYPPPDEVLDTWEHAISVTDDDEVVRWCWSRDLDPMWIADYDLARAIRVTTTLPSWGGTGGTWGEWRFTGHRLIVRAWDAAGRLTSLHARYIRTDEPRSKALWPRGHSMSGLVLCDSPALLRGELVDGYYPQQVIVAEGVPDWLTWALHYSDGDEDCPLVLGVTSGGWSQALADRIPDGTEIVVATHDDEAGNGYATQIIQTIEERLRDGRLSSSRIPTEERHVEIA